jgi:aspartate racemase
MSSAAEKRELLAYLLAQRGFELSRPVRPRAIGETAPLSFAQQRLWFLQQLDPDSPAYNLPRAFHLVGRLDIATLERTFSEIVRRHEVLRTTFPLVGEEPVQVVHSARPVSVPLVELLDTPADTRDERVRQLMSEEARRSFDLAHGPLFRLTLLRLEEEEHIILFTLHHIVSDGWSSTVLLREFVTLYTAFAAGRPSPLAELSVQYADYAIWQRERLRGAVLAEQLAFWRKQLSGAPKHLSLPTDFERRAVRRYHGAIAGLSYPADLSAALEALSRSEGMTLFMTMLTAFNVLLACESGQTDIVVGCPVAGRGWAEVEPLIGFFINTVVLRTNLSGDPTFRELLGRVREVALAAFNHQDVPFEKLVEELQPARDLGSTPIFQVAFTLQMETAEKFQLPGLEVSLLGGERGTTQYDISLNMVVAQSRLTGSLEYDTDLFSAATIARMLEGFEALLRRVVAQPELRLSQARELIAKVGLHQRAAAEQEYEDAVSNKLKNIKRRGARSARA